MERHWHTLEPPLEESVGILNQSQNVLSLPKYPDFAWVNFP